MDEKLKRLRITLSLMDLGVLMRRQRLCREHPEDSTEQVDRRLRLWLVDRPGHFSSRRAAAKENERA